MKIEERFNKRSAELIDVQPPSVHFGSHFALGIRLKFFTVVGSDDSRMLSMHMTPDEALRLAQELIEAARKKLIG